MELNEQMLGQILTRQREEYQRYMGVQVEGLRSDIKLVAEIVGGIHEQLIALRDAVAEDLSPSMNRTLSAFPR